MRATYHCRTANLADLTAGKLDSSLSANHVGAVRDHGDADKGEAIVVPGDSRCLVSVCQLGGILVHDGDVDVGNLIVKGRYKLNASNLRDLVENLLRVPCVVCKRSTPM